MIVIKSQPNNKLFEKFRKIGAKMNKMLSILILSVILTGCAAVNVNKDYKLDKSKNVGLVLGSVSQNWDGFNGNAYTVYYFNKVGSKDSKMLETKTESVFGRKAGHLYGTSGRIFLLELPEGEYNFNHWSINNGSGAYISPKKSLKLLSFTVKRGEINYIGNLHIHYATGKNIFGFTIIGGGLVSVKAQYDRDTKSFKNRYPNLANEVVNKKLMKLGIWKHWGTNKEVVTPPVIVK